MSKTTVYLREDFQSLWEGQDPFVAVNKMEGEVFRALEQRKTFAVKLKEKRFFIKQHKGATWKEVFKNLIQGRLPVVGAKNEWRAISKLTELGVKVPVIAAYGNKGLLPSSLESFLVTEDVGPNQSLEDICASWSESPPAFSQKLKLLKKIANTSQLMHSNGLCHRDYYICHFLLKNESEDDLTLIDLHRALTKKNLSRRWIVKDIGGLYFSVMAISLTQRDLFRFMKIYRNKSLRQTLEEDKDFWAVVSKRALKMFAKG